MHGQPRIARYLKKASDIQERSHNKQRVGGLENGDNGRRILKSFLGTIILTSLERKEMSHLFKRKSEWHNEKNEENINAILEIKNMITK